VGEEKPVIHLLLGSPGLDQSICGKLAVAEVLQNFALLLGVAKDLELAAAQVLELGHLVVARGDSPDACPVAGQLKLHFPCGHPLTEFLLKLAQGIGPLQLHCFPLLLRLKHLADDDLKALALAPLETLATTQHGLQREAEGHGISKIQNPKLSPGQRLEGRQGAA
jgi:hypothetical protein